MRVFQNITANLAEDDQGNKRRARRDRIYFITLSVWIAFLVMLATILTPILLLQHKDTETEKAYRVDENTLANNFTTEFRDALLKAISAVYGIQGYITGEMRTLPDVKSPKSERVKGQYFDTFDRYAKLVQSSAGSITVIFTAPGGVMYQFYPHDFGAALSNWDLLDEDMYERPGNLSGSASQRSTLWTQIKTGKLIISGPYNTSSLPFLKKKLKSRPTDLNADEKWWIDLRQPVYKATATAETSLKTFWGFALVALSIDYLLEDSKFVETMRAANMNFTVFTNTTETDCNVIVSSWPKVRDCSVPLMRDFINAATVHDVLDDQLSWKVAVKSTLREYRLTTKVRTSIIASSVLGTLAILVLVVYITVLCTRVYDGTVHAPKTAPFAMLTVGPCRGEELWELASDQMVEVKDRLGKVLTRQMVRHHAYQIQQVHPLTTSYVTRSVAAAVQMAFEAIEELHCHPIDEPLRRLLGDDGRLLLSYAVHWCNDAVVRLDAMEGGYRYEGPDVVYGGRMWAFAAPNVVTVSPTALPAAKCIPHVRNKLFNSVFLRGVTERQDLYLLWDTTNHKLREAEAFAAEQVRRVRLAQRDMPEMKRSDGDPFKGHLIYPFNPNGYDSSDLDIGSFSGRPRVNGSGGGNKNISGGDGGENAGFGTLNTGRGGNNKSNQNFPFAAAARERSAAVATVIKHDGVVSVTVSNPISVIGPITTTSPKVMNKGTTTVTAGLQQGVVATNPLALPMVPARRQGRLIVQRPKGCGSESSSSDAVELVDSDIHHCDENGNSCLHSDGDEVLWAGSKTAEVFVEGLAEAGGSQQQQEPPGSPIHRAQLQTVPCGTYASPLPALPPIPNTQHCAVPTTAATPTATTSVAAGGVAALGTVRSSTVVSPPLPCVVPRRVLDTLYTSGSCSLSAATTSIATSTIAAITPSGTSPITVGNPRHSDGTASAKPLVVVPSSSELAAAAAAGSPGGYDVSSKSSSGTPSSDGVTHGRRVALYPTSSYDNPLAHNLLAGFSANGGIGISGSGGGNGADGGAGDGTAYASAPLVAAASFASDGDPLADGQVSLDTFSSDLLLRPAITAQADHLLRTVFDRQAVALDVSYDSVRVLVYYFYSSYKILFRPLAAPERHNIYRRLMSAFGVPQQGILEHLAARCAIRFLQRHEETQTLMWDQQRRLQMHAHSASGPTTASASVSDEAVGGSSN